MVWQHEKTRFGGFFIVEKPQSKHKHGVGKKCCRGVEHFTQPVYCLFMGLPRSWWEGSERHIQLSVVEHHPQ
ncbi:hypothetical protein, partial [Klebsiella pneumoniae]|uniref:hypothetical protein n=1 Tax=Klebsiella pneumoniae TaxID=573 RepID=UPI0021A6688D